MENGNSEKKSLEVQQKQVMNLNHLLSPLKHNSLAAVPFTPKTCTTAPATPEDKQPITEIPGNNSFSCEACVIFNWYISNESLLEFDSDALCPNNVT